MIGCENRPNDKDDTYSDPRFVLLYCLYIYNVLWNAHVLIHPFYISSCRYREHFTLESRVVPVAISLEMCLEEYS